MSTVEDDDVGSIPHDHESESETMSQALDPTIAKVLDQSFTQVHAINMATMAKFNDGSGFVAQESKQTHHLRVSQYEASAQNSLEQDGLAARIMQLKAGGFFPAQQNPHYFAPVPGSSNP